MLLPIHSLLWCGCQWIIDECTDATTERRKREWSRDKQEREKIPGTNQNNSIYFFYFLILLCCDVLRQQHNSNHWKPFVMWQIIYFFFLEFFLVKSIQFVKIAKNFCACPTIGFTYFQKKFCRMFFIIKKFGRLTWILIKISQNKFCRCIWFYFCLIFPCFKIFYRLAIYLDTN